MKYTMSFILFVSLTCSLAAEQSREDLQLRRTMLDWHQIMGITTMGLWLATNLAGEEANDHLYSTADEQARFLLLTNPQYSNDPLYYFMLQDPGPRSITAEYFLSLDPARNAPAYFAMKSAEEWRSRKSGDRHKALAYATFTSYAITASLSFFAPSRIESTEPGFDSIFFHKAMIPIHLAAMLMMPKLGKDIEHYGPSAAERMEQAGWTGFGALSIAFFTITF